VCFGYVEATMMVVSTLYLEIHTLNTNTGRKHTINYNLPAPITQIIMTNLMASITEIIGVQPDYSTGDIIVLTIVIILLGILGLFGGKHKDKDHADF